MGLEFYQPFGILPSVPYVRYHRLLPPIAGLFAAGILALSAPSRDPDEPPGASIPPTQPPCAFFPRWS